MKIAHNFKIKVFVKNTENYDEVEKAFLSLLPEVIIKDLEDKKIKLEKEEMGGLEKIRILSIYPKRNKYCNAFVKKLLSKIECSDLKKSVCDRIDNYSKCYIRLSKKDLLEGKYTLTDSGDCFHIKITIAAFPRRKEIARDMICSLIDNKE